MKKKNVEAAWNVVDECGWALHFKGRWVETLDVKFKRQKHTHGGSG